MPQLQNFLKSLPSHCRVLAVSKLQATEKILELYDQGQRHFGENYVQEALIKQNEITKSDLHWHLVGSLQKKKAKDVVGRFDLIHSVDSLELAQALDRRAADLPAPQNILLQLNLAREESKGGFDESDFENQIPELFQLKHLSIRGLMTMPPLSENQQDARPYFRRLREWRDQLAKAHPLVTELSMGTTSDFRVAADEGATWVRIGTLLFGERPPR